MAGDQPKAPSDAVVAAPATHPVEQPSPPNEPAAAPAPRRWRRLLLGAVAVAALVVLGWYGVPLLLRSLRYESTDDAYINSHVTYVSPRVAGIATEVCAEDNQYVEAGAVLVRLDAEPYQVAVRQKRAALERAKLTIDQQAAALEAAQAELEQARDQVRSQVAGLRASWFLLRTVQTFVHYLSASLQSNLANRKLQQANLELAQREYERAKVLVRTNAMSTEEFQQKEAAYRVAQEQVSAAQEAVQQARALLGLPRNEKDPADVPKDIEDSFLGVQYALASGQQLLAQVGVPFQPSRLTTAALGERVAEIGSASWVDQTSAVQVAQARVRQARAALGGDAFDPSKPYEHPAVVQARAELEEAELQRRYAEVRAPISGYVNRRAVNPGTHVQAGQTLLAIRPLQDREQVWVEANFKETQLDRLRIGLPVELYVDAYPGRVFHGRVAGLSPGTGAAMSLLPPENATGNFVKVVQRLPVRIELTEPVPEETPLLVGLSVVPEVDLRAAPTGPNAGQRLSLAAKR
jgi:membrane fusion protein (multidrug efflux system)